MKISKYSIEITADELRTLGETVESIAKPVVERIHRFCESDLTGDLKIEKYIEEIERVGLTHEEIASRAGCTANEIGSNKFKWVHLGTFLMKQQILNALKVKSDLPKEGRE